MNDSVRDAQFSFSCVCMCVFVRDREQLSLYESVEWRGLCYEKSGVSMSAQTN